MDRTRSFGQAVFGSGSPAFTFLLHFCDIAGQAVRRKPGGVDVFLLLCSALYAWATWRVCASTATAIGSRKLRLIAIVCLGFVSLELRNVLWAGLVLPDSLRLSLCLLVTSELLRTASLKSLSRSLFLGTSAAALALCGGPFPWVVCVGSAALFMLSRRSQLSAIPELTNTIETTVGGDDGADGGADEVTVLTIPAVRSSTVPSAGTTLMRNSIVGFVSSAAVGIFLATHHRFSEVSLDSLRSSRSIGTAIQSRFLKYDLWNSQYRANLRTLDVVGTLARICWPTANILQLLWVVLGLISLGLVLAQTNRHHLGLRMLAIGIVGHALVIALTIRPSEFHRSLVPVCFELVIVSIATLFTSNPLSSRMFSSPLLRPLHVALRHWPDAEKFLANSGNTFSETATGEPTPLAEHFPSIYRPSDPQSQTPQSCSYGQITREPQVAPGSVVDSGEAAHTSETIDTIQSFLHRQRERGTGAARANLPWLLTAPVLFWVTISSLKANQYRARNYDAIPIMDMANRVNRLGGTYFTTAADQKGPLFQFVYHVASMLGGRRDSWWIISLFITIAAAVTAISVGVILWSRSHSTVAATALATGTYVYLLSSKEDFSGILYSRNITTLLVVVAFAFVATTRHSQDLKRAGVAGLCMGLAMSTITTEIFAFGVLGLWLWRRFPSVVTIPQALTTPANAHDDAGWTPIDDLQPAEPDSATSGSTANRGAKRLQILKFELVEHVSPALVRFVATGILSFSIAPLWYLFRGVFHEYWYYWFRYNGFYYSATKRSLGKVLKHGLSEFRLYYLREPHFAIALALFVTLLLVSQFRLRSIRQMEYAVAGWWLAGSLSVTFAQRFSYHHFIVVALPLLVIVGCLFDRFLASPAASVDARSIQWKPPTHATAALLSSVLFLSFGSFRNVWRGWTDVKNFRGFDAESAIEIDNMGGDVRSVRAFTELVTGPQEAVFVWATVPWNPGLFGRMSASRFIEKRVLDGYIYLGGQSNEYIPPNGWKQLETDLNRTNAALVIDNDNEPILPESPLVPYLTENFQSVLKIDKWNIRMRKDRFAKLIGSLPDQSGGLTPSGAVPGSSPCYEVQGTLRNPGLATALPWEIRVVDQKRPPDFYSITTTNGNTAANLNGKTGEYTLFATSSGIPDNTPVRVLIGRRAVALLANDTVVSVVLRPSPSSPVTLNSDPKNIHLERSKEIRRSDCFGVNG
jgi:hypothetical protein